MKTIYLKLLTGEKYTFIMENNGSIPMLKELIEEKLNIKKESQRLIYNGSSLIDFNLPDNSIVHLILQMT